MSIVIVVNLAPSTAPGTEAISEGVARRYCVVVERSCAREYRPLVNYFCQHSVAYGEWS